MIELLLKHLPNPSTRKLERTSYTQCTFLDMQAAMMFSKQDLARVLALSIVWVTISQVKLSLMTSDYQTLMDMLRSLTKSTPTMNTTKSSSLCSKMLLLSLTLLSKRQKKSFKQESVMMFNSHKYLYLNSLNFLLTAWNKCLMNLLNFLKPS